MKKKLLMTALILALATILVAMLVACDPAGTGDDGGTRDFEYGKYTVTFKTDSEMILSKPTVTDISYGTKIEAPKDSNGNEIVPVKRGHEFKGWSANGKDVFDFKNTAIMSNLTLTAIYTPRKFTHTAALEAKLTSVYDSEKGEYVFTLDKTARPVGEIGLGAEAKLETTYDDLTALPVPTSTTDAKFCFWYYMKDGKPVQLTRWRSDDKADVDLLTKYTMTEALEIYPMFSDNLPKVTVKYYDTIGNNTEYRQYEQEFVFGTNVPESEKPDPTEFHHGEYSFNHWYYIVKDVDKDGEEIITNKIFVYDNGSAKDVTSPMDAAGAEDNFTPVTLSLYAKWTKEIKIGTVDDYKSIYDKLRIPEPTDAEKTEIERILSANITIAADLDFGILEFEPLFDSEHIFTGTIDGGIYKNQVVDGKRTIRRGIFGGKTDASVFGYIDGSVINLSFVDVGLAPTDEDGTRGNDADKYAATVYIGTVATQNRGAIQNCDVTFSKLEIDNLHSVIFGGVAAVNRIKDSYRGEIRSCVVTITEFKAACEALTYGGIAGINNPTARIAKCTVREYVTSAVCNDDGKPSNGRSSLVMGGLAGNNSGYISLSIVQAFEVSNVQSLTEFSFGGVAGVNTGSILTTHAASTLCSSGAPAYVSGSLAQIVSVGGIAGKNEGYAVNSYCDIKAYVQIPSAPQHGCMVAVGGVMGNNFSDKKDTSSSATAGICAINSCYSTGEISVSVADGVKNVSVYAGGIAGRNSHNKLGSIFSAVTINVINDKDGNLGGKNNLGYLFGAMENESTVKANCYYIIGAAGGKLVLNGVEYVKTVIDEDNVEESFPINKIGTELSQTAFGDEKVLTTLGFSKDDPWIMSNDENYIYPIFSQSIYNK